MTDSPSAVPETSITVIHPGLLASIQDEGRRGLRHLGIPWSGVMVPSWQILANSLVGNRVTDPVVECFEGGFQFSVGSSPVRIALLAHHTLSANCSVDNTVKSLRPYRSYRLAPGSKVTLKSSGDWRLAVLAIEGLSVETQLGSASTYSKASLGGINGRSLQPGDVLNAGINPSGPDLQCTASNLPAYDTRRIRVVMGPQDDHFSTRGIERFLSNQYELTSEADRMGARLQGEPIEHKDIASRDIVSDAIVPGSIQVPGNGQPIVLLSDAHTAGGYPKIATVLSIDLPLLALHRPGTCFQFIALDINEAIDAVRSQSRQLVNVTDTLEPVNDYTLTSEALMNNNLIDGVTDGLYTDRS